MLESELYDRDSHDNAGSGRGAAELNQPAPSVPAAVFQAPQVVFQPPAVQSEPAPASQPSGSARSASPPSGPARPGGSAGDRRAIRGAWGRRRRGGCGPSPQAPPEPQPDQER